MHGITLKRSGVLIRVELQRKIFGTACREKFHAALPLMPGMKEGGFHTGHEKRLFSCWAWKKAIFTPGMKNGGFHARHEKGRFSRPA